MEAKTKGKVIEVLEPLKGTSAKGEWKKECFVIETEGTYPKQIAFDVFNEKVKVPQIGEVLTVHFNVESRLYNGRYYTNVNAWKIETESAQEQPKQEASAEQSEPIPDSSLPF